MVSYVEEQLQLLAAQDLKWEVLAHCWELGDASTLCQDRGNAGEGLEPLGG